MGKVILNVAVTLDGYIEGPNGEYDWCFTDQDYGMKSFLEKIDTILYGRRSYDLMASMDQEYFPEYRRIVFSHQALELKEGYELLKSPQKEDVLDIINSTQKHIWLFGGRSLLKSMMEWELVDRLMLAVHPILLGSGKLLFPEIGNRKELKLVESKTYDTGFVQLVYDI